MSSGPLKDLPANLQFVYVASCHSERVGMIFQQTGVPHVICISQNQTILDRAAIDFSKFFYAEVFDKYSTICEAYASSKSRVENVHGKFHAEKILLLKSESHGDSCQCREERYKPKRGVPKRCGTEYRHENLPTKVTPFLFRNKDMFDVLDLLTTNNIVQIFGLPGVGKSSLLKNVTCFLGERNIYKDGVVYINFSHVLKYQEAIEIICAYLSIDDCADPLSFEMSFDQSEVVKEVRKLKYKLVEMKSFLFSFDDIDDLEKPEYDLFLNFIADVASKQIRFLFASNRFKNQYRNIGIKKL